MPVETSNTTVGPNMDVFAGPMFGRGKAGYEARRRGFNVAIEHHPEDFVRLWRVKAAHDPHDLFRVNLNFPPERSRT